MGRAKSLPGTSEPLFANATPVNTFGALGTGSRAGYRQQIRCTATNAKTSVLTTPMDETLLHDTTCGELCTRGLFLQADSRENDPAMTMAAPEELTVY